MMTSAPVLHFVMALVQDPKHANPPSLFLPIMAMAQQLKRADVEKDDQVMGVNME